MHLNLHPQTPTVIKRTTILRLHQHTPHLRLRGPKSPLFPTLPHQMFIGRPNPYTHPYRTRAQTTTLATTRLWHSHHPSDMYHHHNNIPAPNPAMAETATIVAVVVLTATAKGHRAVTALPSSLPPLPPQKQTTAWAIGGVDPISTQITVV